VPRDPNDLLSPGGSLTPADAWASVGRGRQTAQQVQEIGAGLSGCFGIVLLSMSLTLEVFLRHRMGTRHLGFGVAALSGLLLYGVYHATGRDPGIVVFGVLFAIAYVVQKGATMLRDRRGDHEHSGFMGIPWLALAFPGAGPLGSIRLNLLLVEPLTVWTLSFILGGPAPVLADYLGIGGMVLLSLGIAHAMQLDIDRVEARDRYHESRVQSELMSEATEPERRQPVYEAVPGTDPAPAPDAPSVSDAYADLDPALTAMLDGVPESVTAENRRSAAAGDTDAD